MHQMRDRWQVYDLEVGGISLVANYRAQFSKIIRTESYETLVARLKSHQTDLSAPSLLSSGRAGQ
jgi:phospholipid transport system substrate-binding protein